MRKLVVLMLVLSMASLANAGLTSLSSTTPFVITITAADTADTADVFLDYTPLLALPGWQATDAVLTLTGAPAGNITDIYTVASVGVNAYAIALANTGGTWTGGTGLATFDLNGAAANVGNVPVVLNVLNAMGETIGTVSTMVTPEPATMVLLGLGGLLLKRRKA